MKKKQTNCIYNRLYLRDSSTNFNIFGVLNSESFSVLIANKILHVTVLLLIYFGDQFVASEIRHRRRITAVFVNNQHAIKRQGQDFDTKFVFERVQRRG